MTNNPLLARFDQAPVMVNPDLQMRFDTCLAEGASFLAKHEDRIQASTSAQTKRADCATNEDGFWPEDDSWEAAYKPYKVSGNGTLAIPVMGVLIHNFPYQVSDWITGYEYITRAVARGLADPKVSRIGLVVDSPGGEVAGCFECAERIYNARSDKPIEAFAHEHAYSAAYAIASAASKITVSRTGGVGSIGVVTSHLDVSERMAAMGMKITFIYAGKHKVDGNAYQPLSNEVKGRIQARIDDLYGVFVSAVSQHRGIEESDVRATEAQCFSPSEAMSNGLADAIGPLDLALASFEAELSTETENETMSIETDNSASHEAAVNAAREEGLAAGRAEGATAERERIAAILASDEAKTRPVAAYNVAMNTDMSLDAAKAFLAGLNEEGAKESEASTAGAGGNRFERAMENGNPDLNANSGQGEGGGELTGAAALIAARKAATGFGPKTAR